MTNKEFQTLRAAALAQPGAVERNAGIKFQCPDCRDEGHDAARDNAILFHDGRVGCALKTPGHTAAISAALRGDAEPQGQTSPRVAPPAPVELHTLLARTYPDDPGIVGSGVIGAFALVVLAGGPKLGKTWLILNLVLALAFGRPWLGFPTTAGRSLLLTAESSEPALQKRLGILLAGRARPPKGMCTFVCTSRLKLDRPADLDTICQYLDTLHPRLLIIDPLARFMSGDENSTRDMSAFVAALDHLREAYAPLAIVVVHHRGKAEGRTGGQGLRGSSALYGAVDSVLMLDRAKAKEDGFTLTFDLREGEALAPLPLRRDAHLWYHAGPPRALLPAPLSAPLLAAQHAVMQRGPLTWAALAQTLHQTLSISRKAAEHLIARSVTLGVLVRQRDGCYTLPPAPSASQLAPDEGLFPGASDEDFFPGASDDGGREHCEADSAPGSPHLPPSPPPHPLRRRGGRNSR